MALKATIFKAELTVSDLDRGHFATHALTIARHPSETDERMMVRVLAFAMSHRKIPYEDLDGNPHPVTAGVTTVYALLEQGRRLSYADPWLPAG